MFLRGARLVLRRLGTGDRSTGLLQVRGIANRSEDLIALSSALATGVTRTARHARFAMSSIC
jgi:hypothetical protein